MSWNAERPWLPNLAVKWIDERRGLWMYSPAARSASAGSGRAGFQRRLRGGFREVRGFPPASREPRRGGFRSSTCRARGCSLWSARVPGGGA